MGKKVHVLHNGQMWDKAKIAHELLHNQRAQVRAMLLVYKHQTADEQQTESTNRHNGVGFTGMDAKLLTSFSKQVLSGRTLSEKQMLYVGKKIQKYAGQVWRHVRAAHSMAATS